MEAFRITNLEAQEIGPFGKLTLNFPEKKIPGLAEVHILTGENGTGKTTVLEIMSSCILNSTNVLYYKCRNEQSRAILSFGTNGDARWLVVGNSFTRESGSGRLNNFIQSVRNHPMSKYDVGFFAYSGYRRIEQVEINENPEIQGHPFEDALDFKQSINPRKIINWIASAKINEALAVNQSDTKEAQNFREAITRVEKAIGEIIEKPIQFKLEYKPRRVVIEVAGETLDFNLLPDGLKSIVSWIADLLMRMDRIKWVNDTPVFDRNFILFLDEIEVHLHPAWQRKILPAVQKLFPNAQIFISTHSPFVVGSVDGAWIHKLVKPNGDSQLEQGYPILSEDGKSFRQVLEEVFDITKQFGEGVERQLVEFRRLVSLVSSSDSAKEEKQLLKLAEDISSQSLELHTIVQFELRQLQRKINRNLALESV